MPTNALISHSSWTEQNPMFTCVYSVICDLRELKEPFFLHLSYFSSFLPFSLLSFFVRIFPFLAHSSCSIASVQFSRSVVSDSLRPHESQHARPPCPSQLPESTQTHVHRVSDAIQPSHPLSSPSPPALNLSQHQGLFQ